jgi:glucosyl-dolichyl phosphate glucuronosyltransferase
MDISIIICTYNRSNTLNKVLECVQGLTGSPDITWETLVVDNNSTDETKSTVERFVGCGKGNIKYIFEGRQGKPYALNTGIAAAKGDILAFTDDDVLIDPDWLLNIKKTFDHHDCVGVGGKIIPVFSDKKPSWLTTDTPMPFLNVLGSFDHGEECCVLNVPTNGANMAFKKEIFIKHGTFQLDLVPRGEDTEISLRFLAMGEKLMYAPDAIIYHRVQKEKLKKKLFQTSYFSYGRFKTKTERENLPDNQIYYFGIPRYLYKTLFKKWLDWFFTFESKQRICKKLEYYVCLGRTAEYLATRKNPQPATIKSNGLEV